MKTAQIGLALLSAGLLTFVSSGEALGQTTGTISGLVTLEPPPPSRRRADRYNAAGPPREVQLTSAVVYLEGAIAGPTPDGYDANPEMLQSDTLFVPSTLALMAGGTVSFPNGDSFFHNVFSYVGPTRFDLGRFPQGESREVTFDKPGRIEVQCEVHEHMAGIIVVTENPYHAVVADDGTFSIDGVPPGEYILIAWHPSHDEERTEVAVTVGSDTRVEVELRR